jgi:RNA polymerase sigma-70 factor (ECF subfamily)
MEIEMNQKTSAKSIDHTSRVDALYQRFGAVVLRRARQITRCEHEAEEILQEIFQGLLEKPESLDRARNELAWIYGATTHLSLNRIRKGKNRERLLREKSPPPGPDSVCAENATLAQRALDALPDELSAAFVYRYLDEMTHGEIARILGCSRRQVGNLLDRAHERLERLVGRASSLPSAA